jgi:ribonuclease HII
MTGDKNRLSIEQSLWKNGYKHIAGIDEVGRGPLAGPVYACAVVFPSDFYLPEVRDSKKLSSATREALTQLLLKNVISIGLGSASPTEIDEINIRQATFLAMHRALNNLSVIPDYILVDGEKLQTTSLPNQGIIGGDDKSFTIAAASIIAKVKRDTYMIDLDKKYPYYKFAKNKGYGTKEHIQAIKEHGISPVHRKTFLSKILKSSS